MTKQIVKIVVAMAWASSAVASEGKLSKSNLEIENHYKGIADIISTQHNAEGACGTVEAYSSDIVGAAESARRFFDANWSYNEKTNRKFTLSKETLKAMKSTLALKDIMNMLDQDDPQTFQRALNRVVMWGPSPGAYGHTTYIKFGADYKAVTAKMELLDENPWYRWVETKTTFTVSKRGRRLIVQIGSEEYILEKDYRVTRGWVLIPADTPDVNPWLSGFVDLPSECDA